MEEFFRENWVLFIPFIVLNYALVIYCIVDLFKTERPIRGGNKILWLLIILLGNTLGPIIYLLFGKGD